MHRAVKTVKQKDGRQKSTPPALVNWLRFCSDFFSFFIEEFKCPTPSVRD